MGDMEYLEACTLFDPRTDQRDRNLVHREEYLRRLFECHKTPIEKQSAIKSGSVVWFNEGRAPDPGESLSKYMSSFVTSQHNVVIVSFMQFGLEVVKNLVATALVESLFSVISTMKSKGRCALDTKMLAASCIMRQAPSVFDPSLSFNELWERMKPWLVSKGELRASRTKYRVHRMKQPENTFHQSSVDF
jgi:hypothetical protein